MIDREFKDTNENKLVKNRNTIEFIAKDLDYTVVTISGKELFSYYSMVILDFIDI